MIDEATLWDSAPTSARETIRWMAPELLNCTQKTVTMEADMYAFAMTCLVGDLLYLTYIFLNQQYDRNY